MMVSRHQRHRQAGREDLPYAGADDEPRVWVTLTPAHELTRGQLAAVHNVMRLFVDDDLARGVSPEQLMECDACRTARPMPGFIRYGSHRLCNPCATDYEVARIGGQVECAEQFVREGIAGGRDGATPAS